MLSLNTKNINKQIIKQTPEHLQLPLKPEKNYLKLVFVLIHTYSHVERFTRNILIRVKKLRKLTSSAFQ